MRVGSPNQSLQHSDSAFIFTGSLGGDLLSSMLTYPPGAQLVEAFSKPEAEARVAAQPSAAAAAAL